MSDQHIIQVNMKISFNFLAVILLLFVLFSCEEVEEVGKYDNWRERNEAFIDSISTLAGENYVATVEQVNAVPLGELFVLQNPFNGTDKMPQYIYCKKLVANPEGERPLWQETVSAYYFGTLMSGEKFDGNFTGYGALDQNIPIPPLRTPTYFDSPGNLTIDAFSYPVSLTSGWCVILQYMHTGERWIAYVPWDSAYGASGNDDVPGYSVLTFDIELKSIVR